MIRVQLDLTPYLRAARTGVGQSALRSCLALLGEQKKSQEDTVSKQGVFSKLDFELVSRDSPGTHGNELAPETSQRLHELEELSGQALRTLKFGERLLGQSASIYHSFEATLPVARRSQKLLTLHDVWTLKPNGWQKPAFQKRQSQKILRSLGRAQYVICPSEAVRCELLEISAERNLQLGPEQITAVPWGPRLKASAEKASGRPVINEPHSNSNRCSQATLLQFLWWLHWRPEKICRRSSRRFASCVLAPRRSSILSSSVVWVLGERPCGLKSSPCSKLNQVKSFSTSRVSRARRWMNFFSAATCTVRLQAPRASGCQFLRP